MVFVFGLGNMCSGQSYWTKTYGRVAGFYAIQPTNDGNFLIAGSDTNSRGELIKIKPNGDTLWTKTYDGGEVNGFYAIQPTTDGNFLIAGGIIYGAGNGWLIKIKPNGDTLWTKTFDGAGTNEFSAIQPTSDGNFLIVGGTQVGGLLIKIKPNGDILWTKTFDGVGYSYFYAIQPATDGNFLIAGFFYSAGNYNGWLIKIKQNGDTLWTKTYDVNERDKFYAMQATADGNFLITNGEGWFIKIKPNGDTLWTKTFGNESIYSIQPTFDGNFLIIGYEYDSGSYFLGCLIADQYAYKDSRFTYKIPVYSTDTLNFGYVPLKTPSGMTVSAGGTVSWTPKTDSVYMDHAEFIVMNDLGKKDTLTFNIFVNSDYHPLLAVKPTRINKRDSKPFEINTTLLSGKVKFSMPSFVKSISIYDINGRQVGKAAPVMSGSEANVIWPSVTSSNSAIPTGKYIAKASAGTNSATKPFLLVR